MDAFDSNVIIYAAVPRHPLGQAVAALLDAPDASNVGSVLLLPEVLTKPRRAALDAEYAQLVTLLSRIDLLDFTHATALRAVELGAKYRLDAVDATHLATAVDAGADRFITNNSDDFPKSITEVDVVYPSDLT